MPAKKSKKSAALPIVAKETPKKTVKKVASKPLVEIAPAKKAKAAQKSGSVSSVTDGFVRINETRVRKVYR